MRDSYNRLAGQSVARLAALSDGVFAIAMTLLVLDLRTPASQAIHSEIALWRGLQALAPQVVAYLLSFLTLGIFWNGQAAQLSHFRRSDRHLTWIHLAFLFPVSVLPFSTRLLAEFIDYRLALVLYWLNILALGLVLLAGWKYAESAGLLADETPPAAGPAIVRRILIAQSLYAFGAALCIWTTWASIAFIVAVQLNYAVAPAYRATVLETDT